MWMELRSHSHSRFPHLFHNVIFFKKLSVFVFCLKDRRVFLILLQNHLALFTPERSTAGFFTDTGLASIDVHMIRLAYLLSVIGTVVGGTSDLDGTASASTCMGIGHSCLLYKTGTPGFIFCHCVISFYLDVSFGTEIFLIVHTFDCGTL